MSRIPIHFDPRPTDCAAKTFKVMSEEWSPDPTNPTQLGTVEVAEGNSSCRFTPLPIWLETKYFPSNEQGFDLSVLERLCANPDEYTPRSIYSHRLLQAMRSVLRIRLENMSSAI